VQHLASGQRIGGYEIASFLKAGGMASLYLARRGGAAGFSRHVAIKVVHPHLAQDPTFVRMFLDEAFLSARIQHPNVVHVEELGEDAGTYFLAMEYVHGCALSQLLKQLAVRQRRLPPAVAVWIAIQMADGLHAAHETCGDDGQPLHVVHRDVSPQNVLLSYTGHVKVIDFGIAKARSRQKETTTKSLKGKLRYMAPEQAYGRKVDRRTDLYALGIVLWEMLTLRRFFEAEDDFALLDLVRQPRAVPPSTYAPEITPALDRAVLAALAADPDQRPASMQEWRRMLAEAMPEAAAVDSAYLAELLGAVMGDAIERERRALPESLTGLRADAPGGRAGPGGDAGDATRAGRGARLRPPPEREEVLHTMTLAALGATFARDDEEPEALSTGARTPPPVSTSTQPSITEHIPRAQPPRTLVHVGLGAGVAALLVLVGVAIVVAARGRGAQGTTSIALPPPLPGGAPAGDSPAGGAPAPGSLVGGLGPRTDGAPAAPGGEAPEGLGADTDAGGSAGGWDALPAYAEPGAWGETRGGRGKRGARQGPGARAGDLGQRPAGQAAGGDQGNHGTSPPAVLPPAPPASATKAPPRRGGVPLVEDADF
jgi:serine/threonine-protein kinase